MKVAGIDSEFPPLRLDITTPEHIEAGRKSRERTASGHTGVHCVHLIAGTNDTRTADFEATMDNYLSFATGLSSPVKERDQLHPRKDKEHRETSDNSVI
jgi:hypothetical protein